MIMHPKVLVTGATGHVGGAVVSTLLEAGYPVRALVRHTDARSEALRAKGAEIAIADMCDVERVTAAMRGVRRAFWLPPYEPTMLQGAMVLATAARDVGVEHIVSLTQWLASPSHPSFLTRQHWLADRLLGGIPGIGHTIVNPGLFADSPYLETLNLAAHLGVMPWIFGDTRTAPPSVADIGRVAAAALMNPERHAGRTYRPTGPELLSGQDIASIVGRVLGRKIRLVPTPFWTFVKAARAFGAPPALLSVLPLYAADLERGAFSVGAPNDVVREVTGRPAEPFEAVVRRRAALPQYRRSVINTLRELFLLMVLPLRPGFDAERYFRGLQITPPALPTYAADSVVWRMEHGAPAPSTPREVPESARATVSS
jgi:uncharacterized protein YbjT (DUF2867 family)